MIFRRLTLALAAAAAIAASAALLVFALGFALFALVEPMLGPAGAAAVVVVAAAILAGLGGAVLAMAARGPRRAARGDLLAGAANLVKQRPAVAAAAALGAGALAIRNPKYMADLLRALTERTEGKKAR